MRNEPKTHNDKVRKIFGERAETYVASKPHTDPALLARLVALARPQASWKALDIATGTGHTAFALAPHVAYVTGVDLTPEMLKEAESLRRQKTITNVSFQVADAHRLPFPDDSFDLVVSRRAPHHFSDIRDALGEMYRILHRGARLVIDDRSVPENDEVDEVMNRLDLLHDESHVRQYRPSEWRQLLEEACFAIESLEPYSKSQPIDLLRRDATAENVSEIDRVMKGLTARQQAAMQVTTRDGVMYHLHFYVMIAATKP